MSHQRIPVVSIVLGLLLLLGPSPGAPAGEGAGRYDPAAAPIAAGRDAMAAGDPAGAVGHFLAALEIRPGSTAILEELLAAAAGDPDARLLYTHDWYAAAADAAGRAHPSAAAKELLSPIGDPAALARRCAAAVRELVDFAAARRRRGAGRPGEVMVACWARRAAIDLARGRPALEEIVREMPGPEVLRPDRFPAEVLAALSRAVDRALADGRTGDAIRAARILRGMAVQAGFSDLRGPRPAGVADRYRAAAATALASARERRAAASGNPWTVPELEGFSEPEGEAFTRAHGSFADPGVAVSPRGWYRVETDCGYETLLGAARTVDLHHERLVGWFGRDPFEGRPGILRVVPEAADLESEGAPFWWAGGFQGGDTTVLGFSFGTIEGLGHGITHELTHRFDGAIYPGIPAWLLEGRAVWTGSAYSKSGDRGFVENHANFGTMLGALGRGYGGAGKLRMLIEGNIEDYRDNYVAGYALYLFLRHRPADGSRPFADRLREFMEGAHGGRGGSFEFFAGLFCDGRDGRPDGFDAFATAFADWAKGFDPEHLAEWTKDYTRDAGPAPEPDPIVDDEPTWVWSRGRAEPEFGDAQAVRAGELLLELGEPAAGMRALVWGLARDGRNPRAEQRLAEALAEAGQVDGAWCVRQGLAFPAAGPGEPAPFGRKLRAARELEAALSAAAEAALDAGRPAAAAALGADHDRLARRLGLPPLRMPAPDRPNLLHPFDQPARAAGRFTEDALTDYERHRVPDLWYETEEGNLWIGRREPRGATGEYDRGAGVHHVFVRGDEYLLPGAWRIRTRIRFGNAFVSGAVVLGFTRRDRNVRLELNAGSFAFARGKSEEAPKFDRVSYRLTDRYPRDGALPGSVPRGSVRLDPPRPWVDVEMLVFDGQVQAYLDGNRVGTWHTPRGEPVEGRFGFAVSVGSYLASRPVVTRLTRSWLADGPANCEIALDPSDRRPPEFAKLANGPVRGVPRATQGTLLLWISRFSPTDLREMDPARIVEEAERYARALAAARERAGHTQAIVVAVPAEIGETGLAELGERLGPAFSLLTHESRGEDHALLFVDSAGTARAVKTILMSPSLLPAPFPRWLRTFRDHGRPDRALPPLPPRTAGK